MDTAQPQYRASHHVRKIRKYMSDKRFVKKHFIKYDSLTPREIEIITLLLRGNNNPEIASQLFISRRTVEQHRKNINSKLDIRNFAELYRFGYAFDLV